MRANRSDLGKVMSMDAIPSSSNSPWQPGSVVFAARTLADTEAVLWLVPRFDPLDETVHQPPAIRFGDRTTRTATPPRLRAVWWLFDDACAVSGCSNDCLCGEVPLAALVSVLEPTAAAAAVCAQGELLEAIAVRLDAAIALGDLEHAAELATAAAELVTSVCGALEGRASIDAR